MKLDKKNIERNTKYSQWAIQDLQNKLMKYEDDSEKERRNQLKECKYCYYIKKEGALQALTNYDCHHCLQTYTHNDSNVPHYCRTCAEEHSVCCRCGGKIEEI